MCQSGWRRGTQHLHDVPSMCSRDAAGVRTKRGIDVFRFNLSAGQQNTLTGVTVATRRAYDAAKPFGFFFDARVYIFCIIQEAPHGFQCAAGDL